MSLVVPTLDRIASVLTVSDYPKAQAFYESLGFQQEWAYGEPVKYASFGMNDISFHVAVGGDQPTVGQGKAFVYVAKEIEVYYQSLLDGGIKPTLKLTDEPYGMRDFFLNDPDGNQLGFGQVLEED